VSSSEALATVPRRETPAAPGASVGDRLRWLLVQLPPRQAHAVLLCDLLNLDVSEAAVIAESGVAQIRRSLSAGRERLARQLSAQPRR
jgi:DNA-directed RNA polymerase specialized sigma24 family protein